MNQMNKQLIDDLDKILLLVHTVWERGREHNTVEIDGYFHDIRNRLLECIQNPDREEVSGNSDKFNRRTEMKEREIHMINVTLIDRYIDQMKEWATLVKNHSYFMPESVADECCAHWEDACKKIQALIIAIKYKNLPDKGEK